MKIKKECGVLPTHTREVAANDTTTYDKSGLLLIVEVVKEGLIMIFVHTYVPEEDLLDNCKKHLSEYDSCGASEQHYKKSRTSQHY